MRVSVQLRHGLSYVTGIGYMHDVPIHFVIGDMLEESENEPPSCQSCRMSIRIKPKEVAFLNQEGQELVRDVSNLGETWLIPFTNIDYITENETSVRDRKIRGLKWRISFLESIPDQDAGRSLAITGREQQLNLLRDELQALTQEE